jgi:hypothetical protein
VPLGSLLLCILMPGLGSHLSALLGIFVAESALGDRFLCIVTLSYRNRPCSLGHLHLKISIALRACKRTSSFIQ